MLSATVLFVGCPQVSFIKYKECRWEFCRLHNGVHCYVTKKHDILKENDGDFFIVYMRILFAT
jgi:hypothetical protein